MDSKHVTESTSGQEDIQKTWWKEAIIYQIYPRSFQDSDGDGIGDLNGITSRLDYIQSLGVDIIWLNPIFLSPNDDNGYDISDYREIMREFGTMEDFDRLLKEIHKREMRLVLDLVVNHTSDEHPWFEEARKSRHNPYYNYYHWWPAEKGEPPLRLSYFDEEGNAWMYNKSTDSYYLHYFSRKQPDLNWENPEVRQEIFDMMRFWFDKGIDGFRMDSISLIAKDPSFPLIDSKKYPDIFSFYAKEPRLHLYLHEMNRQVLSKYDCMSVGEGSAVMVDDVAKFVDPAREELNMLYHFDAARIRNTTLPDNPESGIDYSLIALKKMFTEWDKAVDKGWPSIYLGNHDQPRMVSRFGSDKDEFRALSAKMLITFLLTMRGTPYWFAGDEIGMRNIRFDRIEDYNDIDTINRYKKAKAEYEFDLIIPPNYEVANAVGAATAGIQETVQAIVRPGEEGHGFLVHADKERFSLMDRREALKKAYQASLEYAKQKILDQNLEIDQIETECVDVYMDAGRLIYKKIDLAEIEEEILEGEDHSGQFVETRIKVSANGKNFI